MPIATEGVPIAAAMDFPAYLAQRTRLVDEALDRFLPVKDQPPARLHEAMRYSIFAGGKRLRPVLVLVAAEACGGAIENALPAACAVECIHTYSLIHDDLPCMDDDDLRRGRPTSHKVFGEAIAVLAGDALHAAAFEILCRTPQAEPYIGTDYISELAMASGSRHLIAGQVRDIESEGTSPGLDDLRAIHEGKTAALLTCCARIGGMTAGCTAHQLAALTTFGRSLGLAFQVIDDILDVTQSSEKLGKTAGKDAAARKATFPSVVGLDESRRIAAELTHEALQSIGVFRESARRLRELAEFLLAREY
jgi:geranylgeranyl diphosphate synthase type II